MKTYWYNFLISSCPHCMSYLFIFTSEMRRCAAAELTMFVLCLRLSGSPGGDCQPAAGVCRFAAQTKTVLCSNMTSLRGLSDNNVMGADLERIEIHNSQGGIHHINIRTFRILWPTLDQFQRQSWELIHFILEHQKLLRHTAVQCGNKRNRNTGQWN